MCDLPVNRGLSGFAKAFGPLDPQQRLGQTGLSVQDFKGLLDIARCAGEAIAEMGLDQPRQSRPKTPQDIAMDALGMWRDGTWTKEQALRVVQAALAEYRTQRTVYAQETKPWRAALPPGMQRSDADLLDQLFR